MTTTLRPSPSQPQTQVETTVFAVPPLPAHLFLKRIMDLAGGMALFAVLTPLMAALVILILLDSPGMPFFRQLRRGRNGRPFWVFKFRSMYKDAHGQRERLFPKSEVDGILFKMRKDPRVTRLGYYLRAYSLDELPQLLNVIRGDMSLVGPRPFSIEVYKRSAVETPSYNEWLFCRHRLRPGMTGLWQVSGRNDLSFAELMKHDMAYVSHWSLWLDLKILIKTCRVVLEKKGAY